MVEEELLGVDESPEDVLKRFAFGLQERGGIRTGGGSLFEEVGAGRFELGRSGFPREGEEIEVAEPGGVGAIFLCGENRSAPSVMRELVLNCLGIDEVEALREICIGDALAFAGAVHLGATENRKEERVLIKFVVGKKHGTDSGRLVRESVHGARDKVYRVEKDLRLKTLWIVA
jgi:hypothetical protein